MDYDLSRIDYTVCGITYPDTLKILPGHGKNLEQKFAIGDKNGILQCLSIKDEEPIINFKTLPGKPITSVQLASSVGAQTDKIFAASGNEVKGYTRKGKVFLSVETALSDTITSMCVLGSDLILCSGRTVTFYRDLSENYSYICDDRVLDIAAFATPNTKRIRLLILVASKGVCVLENGQLLARTVVSSGPCRLTAPPLTHTADVYAFYGAGDGSIGLIIYEESTLSSKCLVEGRDLGSVVCLGWYIYNSATHLAVGRQDGSVQLYLIDLNNLNEKPRLKFTYFCGEPVTSVAGGNISTDESELLVVTFSGRIFALRSNRLLSSTGFGKLPLENLSARRAKLEVEITRLEKQTANEREKYQRSTRSLHSGFSKPPLLDIQYELLGAQRDGWQEVSITSAVTLDMLFVYCTKQLDMLTDSAAVLSICSSQEMLADFLTTVRCQVGTRRVWLRFRNIIDPSAASKLESTRVLIYVMPAGAPRVARLISIKLPILPQYSQYEEADFENEIQKRCYCQLRASGTFSVAEMTSWLSHVLSGELPRPAANIQFARFHTLLRTLLICAYQRGLAVFKSDDISTIAILRSIISNCSIEKGIRVEIVCDIPNDYCIKLFKQIQEQFTLEYNKNKDIILKNALNNLDLDSNVTNNETPLLCDEYTRVWTCKADELSESHFDDFVEAIVQWYVDWHVLSLNGNKLNNDMALLRNFLQENQSNDIIEILSRGSKSVASSDY